METTLKLPEGVMVDTPPIRIEPKLLEQLGQEPNSQKQLEQICAYAKALIRNRNHVTGVTIGGPASYGIHPEITIHRCCGRSEETHLVMTQPDGTCKLVAGRLP